MQTRTLLTDWLHLFVLSGFAFAQPLFDLLSRYPEYFAARNAQPLDIAVLILVLMLTIPVVLVVVEILSSVFGERFRKIVHQSIVGTLVALIALPILKKIPAVSDLIILLGAALVGTGFIAVYIRFSATRQFVSVLSVTLALFPLLFIFHSPVYRLMFPDHSNSHVGVEVSNHIPIVMVLLDELPITSLMDESRNIDPIRYPNFAALANDSYWYRNATTVAVNTLAAIPSILTGEYPVKEKRMPTADEYPVNIFTILGESYKLNVFESVTRLCPENLCAREIPLIKERLGSLLSETTLIYLHIILPQKLTSKLPDITQNWGGFFADHGDIEAKESEKVNFLRDAVGPWQKKSENPRFFRQFVDSIQRRKDPTLNFLHVILPHVPFRYLASGKRYNHGLWADGESGRMKKNKWFHEWAAAQDYQRSLLQLAYVDSLLGELLGRLRSTEVYDDALIVVVSDHGASYKLNDYRRKVSKTNYMDLMPILMLIKLPGQHEAVVTDQNVETIDILPTIVDVLDTELPFKLDGYSTLDESAPARLQKTLYWKGKKEFFHYDSVLDEKYDTLQYKIDLLGSGSAPVVLYGLGLRSDLIGKSPEQSGLTGSAEMIVEIDNLGQYADIDLSGEFLPARITGRVHAPATADTSFDLAVSINDVIRAVSKTYPRKGKNEFSVIVPETAFRSGRNDVRVFVVQNAEEGRTTLE